MTEFRQEELSATQMPDAWYAAIKHVKSTPNSNLFCLDVFNSGEGTEIICCLAENFLPELQQMKFVANGEEIKPEFKPIPRGTRIVLPQTQRVTIEWLGASVNLKVNEQSNSPFERRNVLFAIVVDPLVENIQDWLTFHALEQRAEAALIFVRCGEIEHIAASLKSVEGMEQVTIVNVMVPIGHREMPSVTSRYLAPDAPGKGQLPKPIPDPLRSPIYELGVMEIARHRFLKDASAVLFCQIADLVQRNANGDTAFHATQIGSGFLKFSGIRAYPFAVSAGQQPRHADHNCYSFDGKRTENIWCAAPSTLAPEMFWRQFRISGADEAQNIAPFRFWRCMSICHPDLSVSEIVPKSSLLLDKDLETLIKKHFNFKAKSPPQARSLNRDEFKNDRVLIVTTMKNEGPFILEWLAYHRAIGVTDFLIYTNDCTDGTDAFLDLLAEKGLLDHRENPFRKMDMKPQHAALQAASETQLAADANWVIGMDVDEFINIHVGDGTLPELFDAVPDATMISMTWRLFGNADVDRFEDRPIIEQFDKCANGITRKPHQAWGFKTMFRNLGHYKKFGVHRPKGLKPEYLDQINWVNGSGDQMPQKMLRTGWRSSMDTIGYDLVMLNHYSLRSAESFLVKRDRGRVNHVDRDQGLSYWFRMNHNAQTGRTIENKFPLFRAEYERLMQDPEIAAGHAACVEAHRKRIDELRTAPEYQALYQEITGERLRALSRLLHHFGNQVFLDGPDAVPMDFHLKHKS